VRPDISIIVPTRGRPDKIARLIESAGQHHNVEIVVGCDDDDETMRNPEPAPGVKYVHGSRHDTLGALFNTLAAASRGHWLMAMGDDYAIDTPDWPAILLACGKQARKRGVLYAHDPHHPGLTTIFCIHRRTYEMAGYFAAPIFPYWFIDTWWDEVGEMTGLKLEMPINVWLPDGRGETTGMRDLAFWVRVFEATRLMRERLAVEILGGAVPDGRLLYVQARVAHLSDPAFLAQWGRSDGSEPSERYLRAKAAAEEMMT
jgi:glycosyltransferase involved in cell wall biosynthesis